MKKRKAKRKENINKAHWIASHCIVFSVKYSPEVVINLIKDREIGREIYIYILIYSLALVKKFETTTTTKDKLLSI